VAAKSYGIRDAVAWLAEIIGPDAAYLRLATVYGIAISLLSLATPISVQLLINSVANTALVAPLWTLSGLLFLLLLLVATLSGFRVYIMAAFERRIFARVVAEITMRAVHAQNPFFADANRNDLFNRYFDLVVVQKAVPSLLIGGFTIILQSAVGLAVTSFYHPFFLAFNGILILALFLTWALWSRGSIRSAVALSHAKHDAARWLESVGGSNGFYKSSRHLSFAMDRSEEVTANYVARHRRYFALLALGGTLILRGELTIGQLVAAELILSGVFYGVSQLGWYLDVFYELIASCEELSLLFAIPQERAPALPGHAPRHGEVRLQDVALGEARFDFAMGAGEQLVAVAEPGADRALALILKRHAQPERGLVTVGGADIASFDMYLLRSEIMVLARPGIVEVSIREYLTLASAEASARDMLDAIEAVGLRERITGLPQGLDTPLASSGYPLSIGEVMALKLANALLVKPSVLMLPPLYDLVPPERLVAALAKLKQAGTTTLIVTGRPEDIAFDGWMYLGRTRQQRFDTREDLIAHIRSLEAAHALPA
jgi:putative ABC transport system ATP-binding protein